MNLIEKVRDSEGWDYRSGWSSTNYRWKLYNSSRLSCNWRLSGYFGWQGQWQPFWLCGIISLVLSAASVFTIKIAMRKGWIQMKKFETPKIEIIDVDEVVSTTGGSSDCSHDQDDEADWKLPVWCVISSLISQNLWKIWSMGDGKALCGTAWISGGPAEGFFIRGTALTDGFSLYLLSGWRILNFLVQNFYLYLRRSCIISAENLKRRKMMVKIYNCV